MRQEVQLLSKIFKNGLLLLLLLLFFGVIIFSPHELPTFVQIPHELPTQPK
jgi:hypothetical protein